MMAAANAVEIRDLVKGFPVHRGFLRTIARPLQRPTRTILEGINLSLGHGEIVGVMGQNGAGKTTLLKIVATIVRQTAGTVSVHGLDTLDRGREVRTIASYTFGDDRSFYWRLTGRQNLDFFAALQNIHGVRRHEAIANVAEAISIEAYLDQPFRFYSAGIRQRFAIARALLTRPRLLLMDEPTRSVDTEEARRIWSLVRDDLVEKEGCAVLLVTHSSEEAAAVCDRVAMLQNGQLTGEVTRSQLRRAVAGTRVFNLTLEGLQPGDLGRLREIPGVKNLVLEEAEGEQILEVHSSNGDVMLSDLIAATAASGARLRSVVREDPVQDIVSSLRGNGESRDC